MLALSIHGYGIDHIIGGDDVLHGGKGNDALLGGTGKDWLYGEGGNNILYGMAGDDTMYSGPDRDQLYGDTFKNEPFVLGVILMPFDPDDAAPVIGLSDTTFQKVFPPQYFPTYQIDTDLMALPGGNDAMFGGDGGNLAGGGMDNDTMIGGDSVDLMDGGPGYDIMDAGGSPIDPGTHQPMGNISAEGEVLHNCL